MTQKSPLPVQEEDPNLLQLPIHLLLPVLYPDLPLQSLLQHLQSHLHRGGGKQLELLLRHMLFTSKKYSDSLTFIKL